MKPAHPSDLGQIRTQRSAIMSGCRKAPAIDPSADFHPYRFATFGRIRMKMRTLAALAAMALATTLAACGQQAEQAADKAKESAAKAADAASTAAKDAGAAATEAAKSAADATKDAAGKAVEAAKDAAAPAADATKAAEPAKDAAAPAADAAKGDAMKAAEPEKK
ncbi:MAG TPA: hypothetical protein VLU54_02510 [Casimicrobiaceae bacterium]|nr:hypothetical protein [Casimicrobiaceae bacterium]